MSGPGAVAAPAPGALGVDLGGTKIEARLLAADGQELWRQRLPSPRDDYRATLAAIAQLVQAAEASGHGPFTVGIGTPGSATPDGLMKNCNATWLNGRPLQAELQDLLHRPLRIDNDANCLALSEATDGAAAGADVVFAAIIGTGTGAGIAVHGRVLRGPNGLCGEWGHNPLPWARAGEDPAPACYCGQHGCIETLVSGPGLAQDHRAVTGLDGSAEAVVQAAAQGDARAQATLDRHASRLARALASVINLLDPDVIVLGGGISRLSHLYEAVPRLWGPWVLAAGAQQPVRTRLVPSRHGDASGARGAAWLWRQT
jgi:fructokinase